MFKPDQVIKYRSCHSDKPETLKVVAVRDTLENPILGKTLVTKPNICRSRYLLTCISPEGQYKNVYDRHCSHASIIERIWDKVVPIVRQAHKG